MEDHHDQSMERDECNVHLGLKEKEETFKTYTNLDRVVFPEESLVSVLH